MGNDLSTARIVAPGAFAINFGAQVCGMLASPNMKQIADRNHYAFSPNLVFISAFFFPQMALQLAWLRRLFTNSKPIEPSQLSYVPIYALGNVCIAGWMFFWNRQQFGMSQALVSINSLAHIYAVSQLPPLTSANVLTHWVAKTTAGIGLLDFVDNGAVALRYRTPSTLVKILTGGFVALANVIADPIVGGCIGYDLFALYSGQQGMWSSLLGWLALGSGVAAGAKIYFL
ncbi:hypothetical protein EW145_g1347 [Phellinidium pouzarii]|uniref:Uncharacterized protein n=1 Tax=Phellinidium pouzarii TaxID=167371 RepID=A0A4S4LER4_9AGAM|nr:hypothetical protein EW145_g1347 [Phellinidium pouzarii]